MFLQTAMIVMNVNGVGALEVVVVDIKSASLNPTTIVLEVAKSLLYLLKLFAMPIVPMVGSAMACSSTFCAEFISIIS